MPYPKVTLKGPRLTASARPITIDRSKNVGIVHLDDTSDGPVALIDPSDAKKVGLRSWSRGGTLERPTAQTSINGKTVTLSRYIMDALPGERIEFVNGNTLDCRRRNLVRRGRASLKHDEWLRIGDDGGAGLKRELAETIDRLEKNQREAEKLRARIAELEAEIMRL